METGYGDREGGAKKFLYSGPVTKRRGPQFDEDVDDREWNFQPTITTGIQDENKGGEFDMDGVWSIKNNVNIPSVNPQPVVAKSTHGPVLSITSPANYYSRYGNMPGSNNRADADSGQFGGNSVSGKSWNEGSSRTYSYTQPGQSSNTSSHVASTSDSRPQQGGGNLFKPGGISQGGRYGAPNRTKYNHQF